MTYYESYKQLSSVEEIKSKAKKDAKLAMLLNPDRLKHIEEAMNQAIHEMEMEVEHE